MQPQSPLPDAIRRLNPKPMTDAEAEDATRNLAGFMALLLEIDAQHATAPSLNRKGKP